MPYVLKHSLCIDLFIFTLVFSYHNVFEEMRRSEDSITTDLKLKGYALYFAGSGWGPVAVSCEDVMNLRDP
jgi:hypothetical protein